MPVALPPIAPEKRVGSDPTAITISRPPASRRGLGVGGVLGESRPSIDVQEAHRNRVRGLGPGRAVDDDQLVARGRFAGEGVKRAQKAGRQGDLAFTAQLPVGGQRGQAVRVVLGVETHEGEAGADPMEPHVSQPGERGRRKLSLTSDAAPGGLLVPARAGQEQDGR